ncbi:MAG: glutathione S-transferase family protein [Paracoccaceae bacterium]
MYILHYAPDNASLVIRLALEELGQPYRTRLVDRQRQEQKGAAYRALNPQGLIPALVTPQGAIFETGAILLWLADRHRALAPMPDGADRPAFLSWLFFLSNTVHADLRRLFYTERHAAPECLADHRARTAAALCGHYDLLEALAARKPGWFAGAEPTALDLYLAALMRWSALYPRGNTGWYTPGRWPGLLAMLRRLETRASVAAATAAEGLGDTPFSAPGLPHPPEGSAT